MKHLKGKSSLFHLPFKTALYRLITVVYLIGDSYFFLKILLLKKRERYTSV